MPQFSSDCPHCGTKSASFDVPFCRTQRNVKYLWHMAGECTLCKDYILASAQERNRAGADPTRAMDAGTFSSQFQIIRIIPELKQPEIPHSIPDNVQNPLKEAELSFAAGLYSAAGSCYRKAIERAVKGLHPEATGMLNKRIRQLETEGLIPSAMIDLLDMVRLFGNSSMHEDDIDPSKEDCAAAREFCQLFLTYAFTLPAKVSEAKQKAEMTSE